MDKQIDPVVETEENVFWEEYQHDFIDPTEDDLSLSKEKDIRLDSELEVEEPILEEEILSEDDITKEILKLTDTDEIDFEFQDEMEFETKNDVLPAINIDEEIDLHIDDDETDLGSIENSQTLSIDLEDEDSDQQYLDENTVAKYRAINAIVSVALMTALLGLAIAIRYFVLN